jgi:hypothetical protein
MASWRTIIQEESRSTQAQEIYLFTLSRRAILCRSLDGAYTIIGNGGVKKGGLQEDQVDGALAKLGVSSEEAWRS